LARAYEIQPSEFWEMTLPETLLEFEMREQKTGRGLGREDVAHFQEWMEEEDGKGSRG
jgi:hypothetical protein